MPPSPHSENNDAEDADYFIFWITIIAIKAQLFYFFSSFVSLNMFEHIY